MKKSIFKLPLLLVAAALLMLGACKKDNTSTEDDTVSSQDAAAISRAVSSTSSDASASAGQVSSFSGKTDAPWWNNTLCGATTVDTGGGQIVITYDGSTHCNGVVRSGSVVVSLTGATKWKDPGAVITVSFDTLKVLDVVTNAQYTLNGVYTLTNETGGLAWKILLELNKNTTVAHRAQTSGLTVTFADGSQRQWSIDRTESYTSKTSANYDTITISTYSEASGNVSLQGTNRYGTVFTNTINDSISSNNVNLSCVWLPYKGETTYKVGNRVATILYGTDASGNPLGSPTVCGDGYYITYTSGSHTHYKFVGYWH